MRIRTQHQLFLSMTEAPLVLGCSVASVYRLAYEHRLRQRRCTPGSCRHLSDCSEILLNAASPIEQTRESAPNQPRALDRRGALPTVRIGRRGLPVVVRPEEAS